MAHSVEVYNTKISEKLNALPSALCSLLDAIGQKPINNIRPGVKIQIQEKNNDINFELV